MLKFMNRHKDGREKEIQISMTSAQGGVMIEVSAKQGGHTVDENILMTPMDAAQFISSAKYGCGKSFRPVGHGEDGADISASNHTGTMLEWHFVGGVDETSIRAGRITFVAPSFVVEAMRIAVEGMMPSLMYPTTGDMEEEFG